MKPGVDVGEANIHYRDCVTSGMVKVRANIPVKVPNSNRELTVFKLVVGGGICSVSAS